jgi:hypothetical protein
MEYGRALDRWRCNRFRCNNGVDARRNVVSEMARAKEQLEIDWYFLVDEI